jgi:hypothetical protein
LKRVRNSCTGEDVIAFRLSTRSFRDFDNPCAENQEFDPWSPELVGLPDLPVNPCLPPGYFTANDTLPAGTTAQSWWFETEVSCKDVDGELVELETNYGFCSRASNGKLICRASPWRCAARVVDTDTTLVIGPFAPGDTRFVIAGVDDLGQRGASNADTIDTFIDRAPRLVHVPGVVRTEPCDDLSGDIGDMASVCATESLLVVRNVQSAGALGTPCAIATAYATGGAAPYGVDDYGSIPLPGETYDLEFTPEFPPMGGPPVWVTEMPVLVWLRDVDGSGRVEFLRWKVDQPPGLIDAYERVTAEPSAAAPDELTPACFRIRIQHDSPGEQDVTHRLYLDLKDRTRYISEYDAAERVSRQVIEFTVNDVAGARYTLAK